MNKLIYALCLFLVPLFISAQSQKLQLAERIGGNFGDEAHAIAVDRSGNVYVTGYFQGTCDFDPGFGTFNLSSSGGYDIFISKTDSSGNFLWAKRMGGILDEYVRSIAVDTSGNVYTTGTFKGTVDFDPDAGAFNLVSAGAEDIFISKLDASGNFIWAERIGSAGLDEANAITTDIAGNVYITGGFSATVDFNPGAAIDTITSLGETDIFILKLDGNEKLKWVKRIGGNWSERGLAIAVDARGNILTTGWFIGMPDFDPGAGKFNIIAMNNTDIYISKLDNSGNFIWARGFGGLGEDRGYSIATDAMGSVYTTGIFDKFVDFDPGPDTFMLASAGFHDIFVLKLDSTARFGWAKKMGSATGNDYGLSLALDSSANVYTTGWFQGRSDFNPGNGIFNLTAEGAADIFISKLDAYGNFIWAKSMGGPNNEQGYAIATNCSGAIYTVGAFQGLADFDPGSGVFNLASSGLYDIFIQKMESCTPTTFAIVTHACKSYKLNDITYTNSGSYTQILTNSSGCDSILTLNLTINTVNVAVTKSGAMLTASANGANYQWVKCPDYSVIPGATGKSYSATTNGAYAVLVSQNGCTNISACIFINNVGVKDYLLSKMIKVFPNPNPGIFNLEITYPDIISHIEVYNSLGEMVYHQTNFKTRNTIEISDLVDGLYFLKVFDRENNMAVVRILKIKP